MKIVGIHTGPYTHLDHLGVLCALLSVPLIVVDREHQEMAKKYYPQLQTQLVSLNDLSFEAMASYDVILESGQTWASELKPFFELLFKKQPQFVYCPHGYSDKEVSFTQEKSSSYAITGNYRYAFYLRYKSFYDTLAKREIFSKLNPARETLLYAPTWQDKSSSLIEIFKELVQQLPETFNLVIKLHPFLEEQDPGMMGWLTELVDKRRNILLLDRFPAIFPLLAGCTTYIGDFSSIGYDFLAFDKPLFFSLPTKKKTALHACGMTIEGSIYEFITKHLETNRSQFSEIRKKTFNEVFPKNPCLRAGVLNC